MPQSLWTGGEAVVEEWQPSLDVVQALFIEDIERERARRQIVTVSQAPPGRKFILAVLCQSLPIITPSLPVGLNTPEYERKEEQDLFCYNYAQFQCIFNPVNSG